MERNKVLEYFGGDELATDVWIDKYRLDGEDTPDDTIHRIAKEFYRVEDRYKNPLSYETIYEYLKDFKYIIPAGSPLNGIGNESVLTSLSNCYVIDSPVDSYAGILKTDEELVQLMKRRGGVGVDISTLRPAGAPVNNAAVASTGAVSFMERYSNTTKEVAQGGRRGALILTMNIDHPDINKFIKAKDDVSKINGANISVKISDEFMKSLYENNNDNTKTWNSLIHQAWKNAEPGVLFWDRIMQESPADCYKDFQTISTNPCGELPLCAYDSCRLMHINMYAFVENPFTDKAEFNYNKYLRCVNDAQRLMDDMIELESEKINSILMKIHLKDPEDIELKSREYRLWQKIHEKLVSGRRTGLNPWLGLADTLAALGISYDSKDALLFAEHIAAEAAAYCYISSITLAKERGAFPVWNADIEDHNPYLIRLMSYIYDEIGDADIIEDYRQFGRRNIACLTIPPSGSVSILARVSSGIEPVFNLSYNRRRRVPNGVRDENGDAWEEYTVLHPGYSLDRRINESKESIYHGSTANEINPLQKVKLQGLMQQYVDHSISITHNLPENTTEEFVSSIYKTAWQWGCKGVTIYRENSRKGILFNKKQDEFNYHDAPKRPRELLAEFHKLKVNGRDYGVFVGLLDNKPYEVFAYNQPSTKETFIQGKIIKKNKGVYAFSSDPFFIDNITGNTESAEERTFTLLLSGLLRHGANPVFITDWINKAELEVTSFGKAISRVLKKYIKEVNNKKELICPECAGQLTPEGGCEVCKTCGYSRCG